MKSEYFILRSDRPLRAAAQGAPRRSSPTRGAYIPFETGYGGADFGAAAEPPPKLTVHTDHIDVKTAEDARRDPLVAALAPTMPITLIAPMALDGPPRPDAVALARAAKCAWGVAAIGANSTTDYSGAGVAVAVLDTGLDMSHAAFPSDQIAMLRRNFTGVGNCDDVTDEVGHGTHCAGTIFGRDVDGVQIGVARGVSKALIGKVLDKDKGGTTVGVLNALIWAFEQEANVISMSLGFNFTAMLKQLEDQDLPTEYAASKTLQVYRENMRAFEDVVRLLSQSGQSAPGALVVAASGNDSRRQANPDYVIDVSLPAATTNIVSVGALMRDGDGFKPAPFSNINPVVAAPGFDIVSAQRGGGLVAMSGTSMACPHVAGLAALWWEQTLQVNGRVNWDTVRSRLRVGMQLEMLTPADRGEGMPLAPKKPRAAVRSPTPDPGT